MRLLLIQSPGAESSSCAQARSTGFCDLRELTGLIRRRHITWRASSGSLQPVVMRRRTRLPRESARIGTLTTTAGHSFTSRTSEIFLLDLRSDPPRPQRSWELVVPCHGSITYLRHRTEDVRFHKGASTGHFAELISSCPMTVANRMLSKDLPTLKINSEMSAYRRRVDRPKALYSVTTIFDPLNFERIKGCCELPRTRTSHIMHTQNSFAFIAHLRYLSCPRRVCGYGLITFASFYPESPTKNWAQGSTYEEPSPP